MLKEHILVFAQCQGAKFSMHSVKEQVLIMQSVKEQIFVLQSVKKQILMRHSVKEQFLIRHNVKEQVFIMHSVKEQILVLHSVKEQILVMHSFKEQILMRHSVKELMQAITLLKFKVSGKETELKTMRFAGELDTKEVIENIEEAKNYLDDKWYQKMQEIIETNKGKEADLRYHTRRN